MLTIYNRNLSVLECQGHRQNANVYKLKKSEPEDWEIIFSRRNINIRDV